MARDGSKTGGRNFKKGQVANPGGFTREQAEVRRLTRENLKDLLNRLRLCTQEQIQHQMQDLTTPAFEMMIMKCYTTIMATGDIRSLDVLLDRLVGKVKDEVDVTVKPFAIRRKNGEIIEMGMKKKEDK